MQDRRERRGGMEAKEHESPQEPLSPPSPSSPPPLPTPLSPVGPESPGLSPPEQPSEAHARQLLLEEWGPSGRSLELPPGLTWTLLFLRRPLYRNLLRSPNPEGAHQARAERSWKRLAAVASSPELLTQTVCLFFFPSVSMSFRFCLYFCHLCLSLSLWGSLSHLASASFTP